ncbi:sensor histidine kinase [Streptomyces poonensis]|uniref:histidine kinase n=1 Tax=Streptomyces poonensis TaxID=68255 RepID=A0A918QDG8_9ACTN|nr:ATP-binding protein [Streptomyces poonensis]GGZ41289.1 ATPase [Streptomyces poonensis]GLJ91783.1 ATPase [Streptomyces poonensis]
MSHLRAPAARADRREGGRHGRPVARSAPSLSETAIRPQLLRLAVLPPVAVTLSACAAVLFTVRSTGASPAPTLWAVLAGAVGVALAAVVLAAVTAGRTAGSVRARLGTLRRTSARGEAELRALVEALRRGETPPAPAPRTGPPAGADEFELLAADLAQAQDAAVGAVVQAAQLSSRARSEQKVEVFVNLARRLQSLVHREISILDELEQEIEDPDLLKGLFHVDHLATRIRRHAENLAVLGGAVSRRQWSHPVPMTEVLRSATAEVEQYSRVKLVPPVDGTVRGHAVSDVIHLLAELVENATVFSAPHTQVLLRASLVTSGLAVEVEDRGLGMPVGEQNRMNALLADPDQVNVARLLQDGRIGLFVVSQLARRHRIHVRLQSNIYGGVQAVLVVPEALLGGPEPEIPGDVPQEQPRQPAGSRRPPKWSASPETVAPPVPAPLPAPVPLPPAQGAAPDVPYRQNPAADGGPVPLPVRDTRRERLNPAAALPGIRPDERRTVQENTGVPPTPRAGAVRGTMGKPRLPRRRAQEHLVPQLRGGPAPAPRHGGDQYVAHDPGLMAAFQRGIGLAETRHAEPAQHERPGPDQEAAGREPADTHHIDVLPRDIRGVERAHREAPRTAPAPATGVPAPDSVSAPAAVPPSLGATRPGGPRMPGPRETPGAHRAPSKPGPAPRPDGSAPAG